jgi:hypothetical protein
VSQTTTSARLAIAFLPVSAFQSLTFKRPTLGDRLGVDQRRDAMS